MRNIIRRMELIEKSRKAKAVKKKDKEKYIAEKKLGTIENPRNSHTIGDQRGSWTTPLKKLSGCNVLMGF